MAGAGKKQAHRRRKSWDELRVERMGSPEARAGYEEARRASEVGELIRRLRQVPERAAHRGEEPPERCEDDVVAAVLDAREALGSDPGALGRILAAQATGFSQLLDAQADLPGLFLSLSGQMRSVLPIGQHTDR